MSNAVVSGADPLALGQSHPSRGEKAGKFLIIGRPGARVPLPSHTSRGEWLTGGHRLGLVEQEAGGARGWLGVGGG
eukprot:scaffold96419_cov32-Tisochrysis_lutea.AAC.4